MLVSRVRAATVALAAVHLIANAAPSPAAEYLVADAANNRVVAFDAVTGAFTRTLVSSGLGYPSGLAIDPDGSLYVANRQLGNVLKVNPATGASTVFVASINAPGALAWDDATSTLFAAEFGTGNGQLIRQYNSSGALIKTIGAATGATGRAGLVLNGASLYASTFADNNGLGSVLKFDAPAYASPIGLYAFSIYLNGASGLAFDNSGNLYVAAKNGQRIVRFNIISGGTDGGAPFGPSVAYPVGLLPVAGGAAGTMLVASLGNNSPTDPIYGANVFPGAIFRYDVATGASTPFLVGDFNNDASVGAGDLTRWTTGYGVDDLGDQDADGDSDGRDFLAWQRSYGNVGTPGAYQPTSIVLYNPPGGSPVPEPSAAIAAVTALVLLGRRRRLARRAARHVA